MNLPNFLTSLRILMVPVMVLVWFDPAEHFVPELWNRFLVAAMIFILASVTDFLDGKIARSRNLITSFGKIADPIADKALTLAAMVCILCHTRSVLGCVFVALIVLREVSVTVFRFFALKKGAVLAAGWPGKVKTATQMVVLITCMLFIYVNEKTYCFTGRDSLGIAASCDIMLGISMFATVASGVYYFVRGRGVLSGKSTGK